MNDRVSDTGAMISGMAPARRPGAFVFATAPADRPDLAAHALATLHEDEGLSLILPLDVARAAGLPCDLPMAMISLTVHSALDGVGLTAAVATALARAGIPANMVAGHHHDHVFVPDAMADTALDTLRALAATA